MDTRHKADIGMTPQADQADLMEPDEQPGPRVPQNKQTSPPKLRRDGRHCPFCLAPLVKNSPRTRRKRECVACRAHPSPGKRCLRCSAEAIWENKAGAACRSCGLHGKKSEVVSSSEAA